MIVTLDKLLELHEDYLDEDAYGVGIHRLKRRSKLFKAAKKRFEEQSLYIPPGSLSVGEVQRIFKAISTIPPALMGTVPNPGGEGVVKHLKDDSHENDEIIER